jgi:hypothetical protein
MSDNARARRCNRKARGMKFRNERAFLRRRADRRTPAASRLEVWWSQTGSNRRPPACKAGALPTELWPRQGSDIRNPQFRYRELVGLGRFELPTSRLSSARSNQLSYKPGSDIGCRMTEIRSLLISVICHPTSDIRTARSRRKRNVDGGVLPMGKTIVKPICPDVSKKSDKDA